MTTPKTAAEQLLTLSEQGFYRLVVTSLKLRLARIPKGVAPEPLEELSNELRRIAWAQERRRS